MWLGAFRNDGEEGRLKCCTKNEGLLQIEGSDDKNGLGVGRRPG